MGSLAVILVFHISLISTTLSQPPPRPQFQGKLGPLVTTLLQPRQPSSLNHPLHPLIDSHMSPPQKPALRLNKLEESESSEQLSIPPVVNSTTDSLEIPGNTTTLQTLPLSSEAPDNETIPFPPNLVKNEPEMNREKLTSILENIRLVLPILIQVERNMSEILSVTSSMTNRMDDVRSREILIGPVPVEEFTFPLPTHENSLVGADNPTYVTELMNTLYPHQKPFEEVVKIVQTMTRPAQTIAYEALAEKVFSAYQNKSGKMDIIELSCEIYGKTQFRSIIQKYGVLSRIVFPSFFDGGFNFYLEAQSKSDIPKNLYFDRRKNRVGITSEPTPGTYQSWTFLLINDGCYFVIKSSESDIIVGVVVTKSKESPLLARNIPGVSGLEEGKINYRFHWKVVPYKLKDFDRTYILLENRETNLALEWNESGSVGLNPVSFEGNQLWIVEGSN